MFANWKFSVNFIELPTSFEMTYKVILSFEVQKFKSSSQSCQGVWNLNTQNVQNVAWRYSSVNPFSSCSYFMIKFSFLSLFYRLFTKYGVRHDQIHRNNNFSKLDISSPLSTTIYKNTSQFDLQRSSSHLFALIQSSESIGSNLMAGEGLLNKIQYIIENIYTYYFLLLRPSK